MTKLAIPLLAGLPCGAALCFLWLTEGPWVPLVLCGCVAALAACIVFACPCERPLPFKQPEVVEIKDPETLYFILARAKVYHNGREI